MNSSSSNSLPSTTTTSSQHQNAATEDDVVLTKMLKICRDFISKKIEQEKAVRYLREIVDSGTSSCSSQLSPNASLLFDVLMALQPEFDEERARKAERKDDVRRFMEQIGKEILPYEVLSLEMNALGADEQATKSRVVKSKTRIYYKQLKFNLLREEIEGYAKLITELLEPSTPNTELILTVDCLIGQFNLDPNRVLDIILECFEHTPYQREQFIRLIRDFKVDADDLRSILALKFVFCQRAEYTPMSLYRLSSLLAQEGLVDMLSLFTLVAPAQNALVEESKSLAELMRARSVRAETISSSGASLLASANEAFPISSILSASESGPEPVAGVPAVSFSAAIQCQQNEDRKLAASKFDDSVLYANQKLGLICALLEHGAWDLAKPLLERLPEIYPFGVCRRIAMAAANIIGYKIEPFYREKYPHYQENSASRMKESWERFTCPPELTKDWNSLFNDASQIAFLLGPYIGARHEVACKLIRLLALFYEDAEAQALLEFENYQSTIVDLCDSVLVPAASLLDSNFAYCEELWQILGRFTYQDRYRIYHRWRTVHTERCWELDLQRGKVLGMTRYIMKRLSKDTAKVMGRQLGKLCHSYPAIPMDYLLGKVQEFQNFIGPVVESIRFLSSLGFDVLAYCLIENLAAPEKQNFKIQDITYSPWLQSLASFAAAIFKRYSIDFGGILQYITNQLKDEKNLDLIVLREIVTSISGVESASDLTQEHLDALCGGDTLRGEASSMQLSKLNRRSINRLRDALLRDSLFESLCILIGQQRQVIAFRDFKDYPLKLTTQMLDQCQETFMQFFHFLRTNLKPEQYAKRLPSALELLTEYHLSADATFCLLRPVYMNEIQIAFDSSKQRKKEEAKLTKLDSSLKSQLYKMVFIDRLDLLGEELTKAFPVSMWQDMTFRLHTIFWLLAVNDLTVPESAYDRAVEKCRKELQELQQPASSDFAGGGAGSSGLFGRGGGATKRLPKDEERLKALEQKLVEEKRRQIEHKTRIMEILSDDDIKRNFFARTLPNKSSQMLRFLQSCIFPRVICSEVDAVYCAEFVRALHFTKTNDFQTIVFFDKIFTDVSPILGGFSERETVCFGRFCSMLLETVLHWHSSRSVFQEECEGFPGCITKIRKKDLDEKAAADAFTYDFFRSICYKWQVRLTKSLSFMLSQQNYVMIRNALTFMLKVLPNFPVLIPLNATIQKQVGAVRDREKGTRHDLNLLASSYAVQLQKRNDAWEKERREGGVGGGGSSRKRLFENHEFSDIRNMKSTGAASGAKATSNGTAARKPEIKAPENVSAAVSTTNPSPTHSVSSRGGGDSASQISPVKRSRPPIRSGKM